jgi:hypothetical protein
MLFPVWFVFRFLLQYKLFEVIESESTDQLAVNSLVFSDGHSHKILLANFTSSGQKVILNIPAQKLALRELNEDTFGDASQDVSWLKNSPATLIKSGDVIHVKPYSVCFLE